MHVDDFKTLFRGLVDLVNTHLSTIFPAEYESVSPTDAADTVLDINTFVKSMLLPCNNNSAWSTRNPIRDFAATEDLENDADDNDNVLCGCILFVLSVPGLVILL